MQCKNGSSLAQGASSAQDFFLFLSASRAGWLVGLELRRPTSGVPDLPSFDLHWPLRPKCAWPYPPHYCDGWGCWWPSIPAAGILLLLSMGVSFTAWCRMTRSPRRPRHGDCGCPKCRHSAGTSSQCQTLGWRGARALRRQKEPAPCVQRHEVLRSGKPALQGMPRSARWPGCTGWLG